VTILIDYGILIPFIMSLFFWTRGAWKKSKGDLSLGVVLLICSALSYLGFPSLAPVSGLPWIFLLLFAVSGVVASLIRLKKHQPTRLLLIAAGICLILSVACYVGEKKWDSSSNSILVIAPYRHAGTWVFDDPRVGLQAEPFVSGIPELIDKLVVDAGISNAHGYQTKVVWRRRESGGNWYYSEKYDQEGWLCPALFKYFRRAPKDIYVKAEAK
jgi:hypothetical protein